MGDEAHQDLVCSDIGSTNVNYQANNVAVKGYEEDGDQSKEETCGCSYQRLYGVIEKYEQEDHYRVKLFDNFELLGEHVKAFTGQFRVRLGVKVTGSTRREEQNGEQNEIGIYSFEAEIIRHSGLLLKMHISFFCILSSNLERHPQGVSQTWGQSKHY